MDVQSWDVFTSNFRTGRRGSRSEVGSRGVGSTGRTGSFVGVYGIDERTL